MTNPVYAGAYVYGKTRRERYVDESGTIKQRMRHLPRSEWRVLLTDHHEGFIDWATYEKHQERLGKNTRPARHGAGGAVRGGAALLQGLATCGQCGRRLKVYYQGKNSTPGYHCPGHTLVNGRAHYCMRVGGGRIDDAVAKACLDAITPAGIEAALEAEATIEADHDAALKQWRLQVERARYDAERAERQFKAVEPENRLVARGLETVVEQVLIKRGSAAAYDLSDSGSLVYITGSAGGGSTSVVWVDRDGDEEPVPMPRGDYAHPRLSPDGTRLAVRLQDGSQQSLWVYEVTTGAGLRLTTDGLTGESVWMPDGERLVFAWYLEDTSGLYWVPADGSGPPGMLTTNEPGGGGDFPTAVTPDGQTLIVTRRFGDEYLEVWEVPLEGERTPRALVQGEFRRSAAVLSQNGAWLAYHSDQSGQSEVYVQPYPGPGPTVPVSIGGGSHPMWSSDGSELIYMGHTAVMAAAVATSADQVRVDARGELFPGEGYFIGGPSAGRSYGLGPDGRLLMLSIEDQPTPAGRLETLTQVVLVQNWIEELKRLVPPD